MYLKYLPQGSAGIIIPTKNIELIISTRPRLIVTYNVEDYSQPTKLFNYSSTNTAALLFDKVEIDDVKVSTLNLDTELGKYQLSVGEHTVAYTLKDPTSIGYSIFAGCGSLTSVIIPNNVISIDNAAFYNCSGLVTVAIPNSVTSIGSNAFAECTSLESIVIPNSVTSVGGGALGGCTALTDIEYNAQCEITPNFGWASSPLERVVIGDSTPGISEGSFAGQVNLTSVSIGSSVARIGNGAFSSCSSLTSVIIPDSVTSIGGSAFGGCSSLTNVSIGSGVTSIGQGAFGSCSSLTSVTIPNNVTSIDNGAFYQCNGLTSVYIGSSVTSMGSGAFSSCSSLTSVTLNSNTIVSRAYASGSSIKNIFGTQVTEYIIGNSVTGIGNYAFQACTSLTNITIPDSVISIGNYAFQACSNLTNVTIGSGVTGIGDYTFQGCPSLTSCVMYGNVTSIGSYAFYSCSNLISINIPNSVTTIGNYAFYSCSSLTSITIPDSVISIGSDVFRNCSGFTSIIIGNGITSIGQTAFISCSNLSTITSYIMLAPSVGGGTFANVKTNGTLYVPTGSSGYETWMNDQGNLGQYNWTKVEQSEDGVTPSPTPTPSGTLSVGVYLRQGCLVQEEGKLLTCSHGFFRVINSGLSVWQQGVPSGWGSVNVENFSGSGMNFSFNYADVTYTCNNGVLTPSVTEFPTLHKRLSSEDGKYYACSPEGKLVVVQFTSSQNVLYCDANNQWLTLMDDYSSVENEFGGSVEVQSSNVGLDGFDVVYNGVTYKYKRQNSSLSPEPELYV